MTPVLVEERRLPGKKVQEPGLKYKLANTCSSKGCSNIKLRVVGVYGELAKTAPGYAAIR